MPACLRMRTLDDNKVEKINNKTSQWKTKNTPKAFRAGTT